ncbi:hypothetical protein ACI65C_006838 [Semiaphis heraclei]
MKGLVNRMLVTGSAASETAELVGTVPVAPPYPSSPCKGERCGGPAYMTMARTANYHDHGQSSATLAPYLTTTLTDKYDNVPLRLRGGNDDINDDNSSIDMDIDSENQADSMNHNPKRFKPGSPEIDNHIPTRAIEAALNNVDSTLSNIRTYLADMTAATKIGKKWAFGMEDFLTEILVNTKKIALEAVETIGVNKQTTKELHQAKKKINKLHVRIGELSLNGHKKDNQNCTYAYVTEGSKNVGAERLVPPAGTTNHDPGEYPPIGKPKVKNSNTKTKADKDRMNKAKKIPVKPTLRVRGTKDMESLWKSIKLVLEKPRVDSAKKLSNGDILVVSTDSDTMKAIKNISGKDGLDVVEESNRKPKVKIKNIPSEYSAEFITDSIIEQNPNLTVVSKTDVKPIFKCGPRNRHVVEWVIEVSPTIYSAILNKRTFIGLMSTFPRPYVTASHCRRCLALDHASKNCTNDITCHHCAEAGHEKDKCHNKEEAPTCAHCGGRHTTMGKECRTQRAASLQLWDYCAQNKINIALIQEPVAQGGKIYGFEDCRTVAADTPGAAIAIMDANIQAIELTQHNSTHIAAIKVGLGSRTVILVSAYFKYSVPTHYFTEKLRTILENGNETIIGADTNGHSPRWYSADQNQRGRTVEDFIDDYDLRIINTPGNMETYARLGMGSSNIDVTLSTQATARGITNWLVSDVTDSDHRLLSYTVDASMKTIQGSKRFDTRRADCDSFSQKLAASVLSVHTSAGINEHASTLTDTIIAATTKTIPLKERSCRFTWNWTNLWWLFIFSERMIEVKADKQVAYILSVMGKCCLLGIEHPTYKRVAGVTSQLLNANIKVDKICKRHWSVVVVDNPAINSFVIANGFIFVFSGLSAVANDDQLSIIVGHELAHCMLRGI